MKEKRRSWENLLAAASEEVMSKVSAISTGSERTKNIGRGASGDITLLADKEAEDELVRSLSGVEGLRILSEEAGSKGDPEGKIMAILDPLDGSSNFERGIPFYCTSVAIVEGQTLQDVSFGLVRNLVSGDLYSAEKGGGATKNGTRIRTSKTASPAEAVVDVDMSRGSREMIAALAPLVSSVRRQVHLGANALELCMLAEGKLDAFVDPRGRMRITDFAAAYLIAKEAGATMTGLRGEDLAPSLDLRAGFSFVASGNGGLHSEILKLCRGVPDNRGGGR